MSILPPGPRIEAEQLDLSRSPILRDRFPGLAEAFDGARIRARLQVALLGDRGSLSSLERCSLKQGIYLAEENHFNLSYELEVHESATGRVVKPIVAARMFPSEGACEAYVGDRLAPLAERVDGREETSAFATPVADLGALNMAVSVLPIDGDLPDLIDATDPRCMSPVLETVLSRELGRKIAVANCRVEMVQYRRWNRCVLRYEVDDGSAPLVVYAKAYADDRGVLSSEAMARLAAFVRSSDDSAGINIPRSFGLWPQPKLTLMEAIPGRARRITRLLKRRVRDPADSKSGAALEGGLEACARAGAAVHASGISLGRRHTMQEELSDLRRHIANVEPLSPELGERLLVGHRRAEAQAAASHALPLHFGHGDFSSSQFVFDGAVGGLVDFDSVCQAEPARDLGQFCAYLRLSICKLGESGSGALAQGLTGGFLDAYVGASGGSRQEASHLRARVGIYEASTLLRLAVKSWRKFKADRLDYVLNLLQEIDLP